LTLSGERNLAAVLRRARGTPGFLERCLLAKDTYRDQARLARDAVARLPEGSPFRWGQRPDIRALVRLLSAHFKDAQGLPLPLWTEERIVSKTLPLLVEWDIRQGPRFKPDAGEAGTIRGPIQHLVRRSTQTIRDLPGHVYLSSKHPAAACRGVDLPPAVYPECVSPGTHPQAARP
jgi:hypothetical protein